jgi:hypothetical protein
VHVFDVFFSSVRPRKQSLESAHTVVTNTTLLLLPSCTDISGGRGGGHGAALFSVRESGVFIGMESESTESAISTD